MNIWIAILVCFLTLLLMCAPLLSVARGRLTGKAARRRIWMNLCVFGAVCLCGIALPMTGFAAESGAVADAAVSIAGTSAQGMGFLAAALSTGLSALGAGIAVAAAAPAAIGAVSENRKAFDLYFDYQPSVRNIRARERRNGRKAIVGSCAAFHESCVNPRTWTMV